MTSHLITVTVAALLAGCSPAAPSPVDEMSAPPSPTSEVTAIDAYVRSPEDATRRVAELLPRVGDSDVVGVDLGYGIRLLTSQHDRMYLYGEDDRNPSSSSDSLYGNPIDPTGIDFEALMSAPGLRTGCAEPIWDVKSYAYDMALATFGCLGEPRHLLTLNGEVVELSTATPELARSMAAHLPDDAPEMAYKMVASSNSQVGDKISVTYADDDGRSTTVDIGDGRVPVSVSRGTPLSQAFPVSEVEFGTQSPRDRWRLG